MAFINESHIEEADIDFFLRDLNYNEHINAWEKKLVGREHLKEVVLKDRLKAGLSKLNQNIPEKGTPDREKYEDEIVRQNVIDRINEMICRSKKIRHLLDTGAIGIAGCLYDVKSGKTEFIHEINCSLAPKPLFPVDDQVSVVPPVQL